MSSPRSLVRVNGQVCTPLSWSTTRNSHGALDEATIILPIKGNPDWSKVFKPQGANRVEIAAGFPANPAPGGYTFPQLNSRFMGICDSIEPQFDEDTCTFTCRSLGAILVDTKTTTNLAYGKTSLQFLQDIAKAHQFQVVAQNATVQMKTVFSHDYMVGVRNISEWDLIIAAAELDDCDVWFKGNTLYYMPPTMASVPLIERVWGDPFKGFKKFHGQHSPQFSKNIEVEVRSYTKKTRTSVRSRVTQKIDSNGNITAVTTQGTSKSITLDNFGTGGSTSYSTTTSDNGTTTSSSSSQSSNFSAGGSASSGYVTAPHDSSKERYIYAFPNLSKAECDKRALAIWRQISQSEYVGDYEIEMSQEILASIDIPFKMRASQMPWPEFDQVYRTRRFTESFSNDQGWTLGVTGVFHKLPNNGLIYQS